MVEIHKSFFFRYACLSLFMESHVSWNPLDPCQEKKKNTVKKSDTTKVTAIVVFVSSKLSATL